VKNLSGFCMGLLLALASPGIAAATSTGPNTKPVAVNIFGTGQAAAPANVDTSNGNACLVDQNHPWVDECPSENCECVELSSPKASNGQLSVSHVFFTIDKGVNPATQPAVGGGPNPGCNLVLGTMDLADNSGNTETVNFLGTTCRHVIAITGTNPQGNHDKDILSGGWGISDSPAPNPAESGWGTFAGSVNAKNQAVTLHLQGWISK